MIKAYLDRILVPFPLFLRPSLLLGLFELMSAGGKERFNSDYWFYSSETESVCAIASILFLFLCVCVCESTSCVCLPLYNVSLIVFLLL